jgi:hypothetical protein
VFQQLDYRHLGSVTREDFETLCEVLELSRSPPPSARNSGLEWLASYRPRPNSPGSPLRLDRLADAPYKAPQPSSSPSAAPPSHAAKPQTNFLWTIGPRPFWELWPQKKRRKKHLNLEEFTRCLLEQWAKTHAYPLPTLGETVWTDLRNQLRQQQQQEEDTNPGTAPRVPPTAASGQSEDTRARRLIREGWQNRAFLKKSLNSNILLSASYDQLAPKTILYLRNVRFYPASEYLAFIIIAVQNFRTCTHLLKCNQK